MKKGRVIYNNYDLSDFYDETKQFIMDEYPELCTVEVGIDEEIHMEPSDSRVWDFIYSNDNFEWENCWNELLNFFGSKNMIMFGSVGRWNGSHDGFSIGSFEELFRDIVCDCDYLSITDENGHFYIQCSHHDGTNCVELRVLNDKGYELFDNWQYGYGKLADRDESYVCNLLVNNLYSNLPHYAKKVFG